MSQFKFLEANFAHGNRARSTSATCFRDPPTILIIYSCSIIFYSSFDSKANISKIIIYILQTPSKPDITPPKAS